MPVLSGSHEETVPPVIAARWTHHWFDVPNALFDLPLDPLARLAYVYLLRWDADRAQAFPGYARMAQDTGMSRSSAIRAIQALVAAGLLTKVAQVGAPNRYHLFHPEDPDNARRAALASLARPTVRTAEAQDPGLARGIVQDPTTTTLSTAPTGGSIPVTPPTDGRVSETPPVDNVSTAPSPSRVPVTPTTGSSVRETPPREAGHSDQGRLVTQTPDQYRSDQDDTHRAHARAREDVCVWIDRLVAEGLGPPVATGLARQHPDRVQTVLAYLATRRAQGRPSPFRTPGGLRRAIEEAWILNDPSDARASAPTLDLDLRAFHEVRCPCGFALLTNAVTPPPCSYCGAAMTVVPVQEVC